MKVLRTKFFIGIFAILLLLIFGYYFRNDVYLFLHGLLNPSKPCQKPITYSIANLDPRFGLTKAALLNDLKKAEIIWESPINKQLFEYSPTGDLKINLIYDYRQKATDAMKKIGIVIHDDRSSYDALKTKYDLLIVSYKKQKALMDSMVAAYNAEKIAYEKDITYWNSRGGAPKEEYVALEQKRTDLNNQAAAINQVKDSLNGLGDTINSAEVILNKLVAELNLQVNTYNTAGSSTGKIFNEGEYTNSANGTAINIFQFNDSNQLEKVLVHELGHALGLEHQDNPKAIMYYLNEGMNVKLTADDLAALKGVCGIK